MTGDNTVSIGVGIDERAENELAFNPCRSMNHSRDDGHLRVERWHS